MSETTFWSDTVPKAISIYAIVIFAVLWIGFAVVIFVDRGLMDLIWNWVRSLPAVPEIIIWILFLPILVLLWIWESSWPTLMRLLGFVGLFAWTLLAVSGLARAMR